MKFKTLLFLVLFSSLSMQLQAGITRGCSAGYQINLEGVGQSNLKFKTRDIVVGLFSARGGCGNKGVADRCRRRARDGAHYCMSQHWKNPESMPAVCDNHGGKGVRNYPDAWSLIGPKEAARVEALSICSYLSGINPGTNKPLNCPANMRAVVYATTRGNEGCKKNVRLGVINIDNKYSSGGEFKIDHSKLSRTSLQQNNQTISKSKYSYSFHKNGKIKKYSSQSTVFSQFDKNLRRYIPYTPREHAYYGCGRHAAQHMSDWMTGKQKVAPFSKVYAAVHLTAHVITKYFEGQKAVIPLDLRKGMNQLLKGIGLDKEFRAVTHYNTSDPQAFMRRTIAKSSPVVALVQDGAHWVTVMGYWSPLLSKPDEGYFYHMNNGFADMDHWSHFDLKFSTKIKAASLTIPSYNEGTMFTWAKR